jgi:hypothetical protein
VTLLQETPRRRRWITAVSITDAIRGNFGMNAAKRFASALYQQSPALPVWMTHLSVTADAAGLKPGKDACEGRKA